MKSRKYLPWMYPGASVSPMLHTALKVGTWRVEVPVLTVRVLDNCVPFIAGAGFSEERI